MSVSTSTSCCMKAIGWRPWVLSQLCVFQLILSLKKMIRGTTNWDNVLMDFPSRRELEPVSQMYTFINIRKVLHLRKWAKGKYTNFLRFCLSDHYHTWSTVWIQAESRKPNRVRHDWSNGMWLMKQILDERSVENSSALSLKSKANSSLIFFSVETFGGWFYLCYHLSLSYEIKEREFESLPQTGLEGCMYRIEEVTIHSFIYFQRYLFFFLMSMCSTVGAFFLTRDEQTQLETITNHSNQMSYALFPTQPHKSTVQPYIPLLRSNKWDCLLHAQLELPDI